MQPWWSLLATSMQGPTQNHVSHHLAKNQVTALEPEGNCGHYNRFDGGNVAIQG